MKPYRPALAALLALLASAPAVGQAADPRLAELEERVAQIFAAGCAQAGCHAGPVPQMNLSLEPGRFRAATVGQPAVGRPDLQLVHPGQPDRSYLIMKMEGRDGIIGAPMPFGGERLSRDQIQTVRAWISRLAGEERSDAAPTAPAEAYAFFGWRLVNLPTNREVAARTLLFGIGHRFNPPVASGVDALFGLDGSSVIFLSLGYAPIDGLVVTLGRSNVENDVELGARYLVARQGRGGWPVSAGVLGTLNWWSGTPLAGDGAHAVMPSAQLIVTRAFGDRVGAAVVPGVLFNPAASGAYTPPLFTLGLGGRYRFSSQVSVLAEWVPIVHGYVPTRTFGNLNRFDAMGLALEIATAGHVFQITAGNSVGIATDQYLRGGDLDPRRPDLRLGFNIYRLLNI